MALRDKYAELVNVGNAAGITNFLVREQDGVLYIDGTAPSEDAKQKLWDAYGRLDPDYRSGDLVMNINVLPGAASTEYEVVKGDSLSKIGKKLGVKWKEIYEANKDRIKDPDHIEPGWKLKIPV